MNRWVTLALLVAVASGLFLRWPALNERPMHHDEAVNGIKILRLLQTGQYRYDPNEHHGPTLYYFTAALIRATATPAASHIAEDRLRMLTVLFGVGLILTVLLLRDALGPAGMAWAGLLTAVSPAFVFYSSYYIHEMLLVFFAALTLAAAWRYWRSRKLKWACLAGVSFGMMAATKETFVFTVAAAVGAAILTQLWNRYLDAAGLPIRAPRLNYTHLAIGALVALFTAALLFTSFFTNPKGLLHAITTYEPWFARAGGESPHIQSWIFYWERLLWFASGKGPIWTELMILVLAVIGGAAGFHRHHLGETSGSLTRFLSFYTLLLAGVYTAIPYKTPWCLLNFWHPAILLAGVGASWIIRRAGPEPRNIAAAILLLAGTAHLAAQSWRAITEFSASTGNPYVYAQTVPHSLRLVDRIRALATVGDGKNTVVKVAAPQAGYWPLPWYLSDFENTGWWDAVPEDPYAPIMVISSEFKAGLDDSQTHLMTGYYELRPGVFLELYVELDLWKKYLAALGR